MKGNKTSRRILSILALVPILLELAAPRARAEGTWTQLTNVPASFYPGTALLLTDGTVMMEDDDPNMTNTNWYKLSPDVTGRYDNGTITTIHPSHCPHGSFASQVLQSGKVFIAGGEYGAGGAPAGKFPGCATPSPNNLGQIGAGVDTELYDPADDSWTMINPPINLLDPSSPGACYAANQGFGDMISETLPDGSVLMAHLTQRMLATLSSMIPMRARRMLGELAGR
jgi:hypothetical protein